LALGTFQNTILDISAPFRENGQPNSTKNNNLQLSFNLQCRFRAYKNADSKEHQQKAISACLIAKIAKQKLTKLQRAITQLTILAFFFAMCSCKYVKVQQLYATATNSQLVLFKQHTGVRLLAAAAM
jgi:hypothetical protein